MAIFNSYVKLPEGMNKWVVTNQLRSPLKRLDRGMILQVSGKEWGFHQLNNPDVFTKKHEVLATKKRGVSKIQRCSWEGMKVYITREVLPPNMSFTGKNAVEVKPTQKSRYRCTELTLEYERYREFYIFGSGRLRIRDAKHCKEWQVHRSSRFLMQGGASNLSTDRFRG